MPRSRRSLKITSRYRLWFEFEGEPVLGLGGARILEEIERSRSMERAASNLAISYRYLWSYVRRMESRLGKPLVVARRGGFGGGGGAELTPLAKGLVENYRRVEKEFQSLAEKCVLEYPAVPT